MLIDKVSQVINNIIGLLKNSNNVDLTLLKTFFCVADKKFAIKMI